MVEFFILSIQNHLSEALYVIFLSNLEITLFAFHHKNFYFW